MLWTRASVAAIAMLVLLATMQMVFYFRTQPVDVFRAEIHEHAQKKDISGATSKVFSGNKKRFFLHGSVKPFNWNVSVPEASEKPFSLWGVVTTINQPSEAIKLFIEMSLEKWYLVIVSDKSTPEAPYADIVLRDPSKIHFLSVGKQETEETDFSSAIPWNHFSRKNLGYLYAIREGATQIWDFDDDNEFNIPVDLPCWNSSNVGLFVTGSKNFNPYPLFHPSSSRIWPRGFPLELVKQNDTSQGSLRLFSCQEVSVVQSLANQDPDVDAVYRMTMDLPVFFSNESKTVLMSEGVFSPYNAQATLHMYSGFWCLLLPISVHGRVSDIWRSYLCQRLMWDIGTYVAFVNPRVNQIRNSHRFSADFVAEDDLYKKSLALTDFLWSWEGQSTLLPDRIIELFIELYEREFVELEDISLVQNWLLELTAIGYRFPDVKKARSSRRLSDTENTMLETHSDTENTMWGTQSAIREHSPSQQMLPLLSIGKSRRRVLITGITGMLGSEIARAVLTHYDWEVFGLIRWRSSLLNLRGLLHRIHVVKGDIMDAFRMQEVVSQILPDYIFHMAAQAINGVSFSSPMLTLEVNILGTLNLLEAVKSSKVARSVRVLIAGSSTEYGLVADSWEKGPIPETAPLKPVTPYGVSKASAEMLANQYFYDYGIQVITARFFIHVGSGGTDNLALQDFCKQIALIEQGHSDPVLRHGNLDALRDVTDISDSIPAVVKLLEVGNPGEAYNVNSGITYSTLYLLDLALQFSTKKIEKRKETDRLRSFDEKVLVGDNSKLCALTGWKPQPNIERTVKLILDFWRWQVAYIYPTPGSEAILSMSPNSMISDNSSSDYISLGRSESNPNSVQNELPCPTSNIDFFIVASPKHFPMLDLLLRSIELFMSCHGKIHIIHDEEDYAGIQGWIMNGKNVHLHVMPKPSLLENVIGYIKQAWIMMYADLYSASDFVMFMDTDSILTLPVTCNSLFDDDGRIYMPGWVLSETSPQFEVPCKDFLGFECAVNYMSYFPFTMPRQSIERMRNYIADSMSAPDFDVAFSRWWNMSEHKMGFSQFVIMGTYMEAKESEKVNVILCPHATKLTDEDKCANYVHPGLHYGWRPCAYLGSCVEGSYQIHIGDGAIFNKKYSLALIAYLSEVMTQGFCLKWRLTGRNGLPGGCTPTLSSSLHREVLTYQNRPVNMSIQDFRFNDDVHDGSVCKSRPQWTK